MDKVQIAAMLFKDDYSLSGLLGTHRTHSLCLIEFYRYSREAGCPGTP